VTQKTVKAIQLAFGGMALKVFEALNTDPRIDLQAIVTPEAGENIYRDTEILPQEKAAEEKNVEIVRTFDLKFLHQVINEKRPDIVIIATFCKIIPSETLALSKFLNIHHGKLPRQRGRANVNWSIINDEPSVSVSIHEAAPELDAGDIVKQFHIAISDQETVSTLYDQINDTLQKIVPDLCIDYLDNNISRQQQDHSRATYFCTRLPEDGLIDWSIPGRTIFNFTRALYHPFPGAYTYLNGQKMTIWSAEILNEPRRFEGIIPGRVVSSIKGEGIEVLTGDGPILLREIEYGDFYGDPAEIIKSSFITLGINPESLLARIAVLEQALNIASVDTKAKKKA
jgi:methionyl-tRNA formyltransferase